MWHIECVREWILIVSESGCGLLDVSESGCGILNVSESTCVHHSVSSCSSLLWGTLHSLCVCVCVGICV